MESSSCWSQKHGSNTCWWPKKLGSVHALSPSQHVSLRIGATGRMEGIWDKLADSTRGSASTLPCASACVNQLARASGRLPSSLRPFLLPSFRLVPCLANSSAGNALARVKMFQYAAPNAAKSSSCSLCFETTSAPWIRNTRGRLNALGLAGCTWFHRHTSPCWNDALLGRIVIGSVLAYEYSVRRKYDHPLLAALVVEDPCDKSLASLGPGTRTRSGGVCFVIFPLCTMSPKACPAWR